MWKNIKRIESSDANVLKFVFTNDDAVAEAVLYKYPTYKDRTVICISTQSGCPIGCRFCGAGDHFVRSLTDSEIVDQVSHVLASEHVDGTAVDKMQIMFMSMGEPMLNYKNVEEAIKTLYAWFPKAALLISTSGPRVDYEPLRKLSKEINTIGLQFSIHESTNEARNKLIPFDAKLELNEIARVGMDWGISVGRKPFINYCAHSENTSIEDADRLANLFDPGIFCATISVICERDEHVAAANARQRELASNFQKLLRNRGFDTRVFNPAGQDDIGGGCGQLWYVQSWMEQNKELVKNSRGNGLPVVHTPTEDK